MLDSHKKGIKPLEILSKIAQNAYASDCTIIGSMMVYVFSIFLRAGPQVDLYTTGGKNFSKIPPKHSTECLRLQEKGVKFRWGGGVVHAPCAPPPLESAPLFQVPHLFGENGLDFIHKHHQSWDLIHHFPDFTMPTISQLLGL